MELETGTVLLAHVLPPYFFGEGITIFGDEIIQLTWTSRTGFIYDKATLDSLDAFYYPTEGWGLTHDGAHLIMSDGSSMLRYWDPGTFEQLDSIDVSDGDGPVNKLNELEYVRGEIYANVYTTNLIARISPETGKVVGWIDLTGILSSPPGVLNGIAYDPVQDRLFVTGKYWPWLYEIELVRVP